MPASLPDQFGLPALQRYVAEMIIERGFDGKPVTEKCLLLAEEIGELCKAIRKQENLQIDAGSKAGTISEEIADILIVLTAIANHYGIDLEQAFRDKEAINHGRTWKPTDSTGK